MNTSPALLYFAAVALTSAAIAQQPQENELRRQLDPSIAERLSKSDLQSLRADFFKQELASTQKEVATLQAENAALLFKENQLKKVLQRAQLQALSDAITAGRKDQITSVVATSDASMLPRGDESFVLRVAIWKVKNIPVYWENASSENAQEREWIREAVTETWEKHSGLRFVGWEQAKPDSMGIRILLNDEHPHAKRLGRFISGVKNGMVINTTFRNWCPICAVSYSRKNAIQWLAVHEFGHALGFAHEHNRDDRDPRCSEEPQGTNGDWKLTVYDPDSVMNYCNHDWNNKGELSELDIIGLQLLYGGPDGKAEDAGIPNPEQLHPGPDPVQTIRSE